MNLYDEINNIEISQNIIKGYLDIGKYNNSVDVSNANINFLSKHKLVPIWFDVLKQNGDQRRLTRQMYYMLTSYFSHIEREQEIKLAEIEKIGKVFQDNGLPYAIRKGIALLPLYKEKWHRCYNDIDLLVDSTQIDSYLSILYSHGYVEGIYKYSENSIVKHSRFDLIKYKLSPDHYPHLVKVVNEIPVIIDLAFTSCWKSHDDEMDFGISTVVTDIVDGVICLSKESLYFDTMLHLYRESHFLSALLSRPPYFLCYLDFILLMRKYPEISLDTFNENSLLKNEVKYFLSSESSDVIDYKIDLIDSVGNNKFEIFSYMAKSTKSDSKKMIEHFSGNNLKRV